MAELPLLIFPQPKQVSPPKGNRFFPQPLPIPEHSVQIWRLTPQMKRVEVDFAGFSARFKSTMQGEPEMVLVLELAKRIDSLQIAVEKAGLNWLGEWDIEIDGDEYFPARDSDKSTKPQRDGRLFISMVNQSDMQKLLRLWKHWESRPQVWNRGLTPWRDIFACLKNIRHWGHQETLDETGMREYFQGFLDNTMLDFQIECFYHRNANRRAQVAKEITGFVQQAEGKLLSEFIDMQEIAFHAVKVSMPAKRINELIEDSERTRQSDMHLFISPSVMYFRQIGQSIATAQDEIAESDTFPPSKPKHPAVAAILDGVPSLQHEALQDQLDFDDPFDLAKEYRPGERNHGTAIASLIIHGDRSGNQPAITSRLHHVAVMQPDPQAHLVEKK